MSVLGLVFKGMGSFHLGLWEPPTTMDQPGGAGSGVHVERLRGCREGPGEPRCPHQAPGVGGATEDLPDHPSYQPDTLKVTQAGPMGSRSDQLSPAPILHLLFKAENKVVTLGHCLGEFVVQRMVAAWLCPSTSTKKPLQAPAQPPTPAELLSRNKKDFS